MTHTVLSDKVKVSFPQVGVGGGGHLPCTFHGVFISCLTYILTFYFYSYKQTYKLLSYFPAFQNIYCILFCFTLIIQLLKSLTISELSRKKLTMYGLTRSVSILQSLPLFSLITSCLIFVAFYMFLSIFYLFTKLHIHAVTGFSFTRKFGMRTFLSFKEVISPFCLCSHPFSLLFTFVFVECSYLHLYFCFSVCLHVIPSIVNVDS